MSAAFGLTVIIYAIGVAWLCAGCAVAGRIRPPVVVAALAMVQLGVVVQAVLDLVRTLGGSHGDELATHIGYLVTSLVVVPVTAACIRLDPGRWGSAALAMGCVLVAVVSLRLHQTSGAAYA